MSARPTHRRKSDGQVVFPDGYRDNQLEPLPAGYWQGVDRAERKRAIKAEAQARIYVIAPAWRQTNDIVALITGETHPEYAAARRRISEIDAVRAWSNAEEARIDQEGTE